jgi:hypothetical protein
MTKTPTRKRNTAAETTATKMSPRPDTKKARLIARAVKLLVLGLPAGFMLPSVVGRCRHMIASGRSGEPI